jgi:hypothetical protein
VWWQLRSSRSCEKKRRERENRPARHRCLESDRCLMVVSEAEAAWHDIPVEDPARADFEDD